MTKVVFLEPPPVTERMPERYAGCSYELYHFPDLGNLYPMTCLEQAGAATEYVDASMEGLDAEGFRARVRATGADAFVIHAVVLAKPTDLFWIRELLALCPQAKILLHGPEATRVPQEYLVDPRVIVFRGEPEKPMVTWLKEGRLTGASFLEDGIVRHVPHDDSGYEMDELPIPRRDHPSLKPYMFDFLNPKYNDGPFTTALASRGCSFRCRFCVPISISYARELEEGTNGKTTRVKKASAKRVVEEAAYLHGLGYRSIHFTDDQFLWEKSRTLEIMKGLKPLGLKWGCLSRADFLTDEEVVRAMAEAGCVSVDIGVESLNQRILDEIRKDLKVEDVEAAVALLNRHGISPKLNIMFGTTPSETEADVLETITRLKAMEVRNVMFTIATPFKGSEFYRYVKEKGFLVDDSDSVNPMGKSMISYPTLTKDDLERLEKLAYRSFYLRPGQVVDRLKRIRSPRQFAEAAKIAVRILR